MKFTREMLEHVALAARMETAGKEQQYINYLEGMTDRLAQLTELDLTDVTPTGRIAPQTNQFREDAVLEVFPENMNLKNAPALREGYFRVPRII